MSRRKLFSKRFGQVLLANPAIAEFEIHELDVFPGARVLEIGGGEGALTELLLERDVQLDCVEPDGRFAELLLSRFQRYSNAGMFNVIRKSFLDMQPGEYDRIIGNIPYHISSGIVFMLPEYRFHHAILMVQKDFAERMVAAPGEEEYSRLSVNCFFQFETRILKIVGRENFTPVPKVDSAVIKLTPKNINPGVEKEVLDDLLVRLFSNRRKKVGTVVKECPEALKDKRPEELTPGDFISVAKSLNRS